MEKLKAQPSFPAGRDMRKGEAKVCFDGQKPRGLLVKYRIN